MITCRKCALTRSHIEGELLGVPRSMVSCADCGAVYASNLPPGIARHVLEAHRALDVDSHAAFNARMLEEVADKPCRIIALEGEPYCERYFMGDVTLQDRSVQWWLHRFVRNQAEHCLHSHAWDATALVISGWYLEESQDDRFRMLQAGNINAIDDSTVHRIAAVAPNTWTSLFVKPNRRKTWLMYRDDGTIDERPSDGADWHKNYGPRKVAL